MLFFRRKAKPLAIPEGWAALDATPGTVQPGDAYADKSGRWVLFNAGDKLPSRFFSKLWIRKCPPPAHRIWMGGETPAVTAAMQTALDLQSRMQQAVDRREDVQLEDHGNTIVASGPLGGRYSSAGELIITATLVTPAELARYLQATPIFDHRSLDYLPPGTDEILAIVYRDRLRRLPESARRELYAIGGMQAVRDMAMRLAKAALGRSGDDGAGEAVADRPRDHVE